MFLTNISELTLALLHEKIQRHKRPRTLLQSHHTFLHRTTRYEKERERHMICFPAWSPPCYLLWKGQYAVGCYTGLIKLLRCRTPHEYISMEAVDYLCLSGAGAGTCPWFHTHRTLHPLLNLSASSTPTGSWINFHPTAGYYKKTAWEARHLWKGAALYSVVM